MLVASLLASSCSGDGEGEAGRKPTTEATTSTTHPDGYAVGRRFMEFVDPSRPTAGVPEQDRPAEPDRTIPVMLLYPASGEADDAIEVQDDTPPAEGEFPLVVWVHGLNSTGPDPQEGVKDWAAEGYIVALPTFPLTSAPAGVLTDYVNQPADVSFLIDQLLGLPEDDALAEHVDAESIAVTGHSLGGMTAIGLGFNSCCADDRLDAVIEMSGVRAPFPEGEYGDLGRVPLLAVHGALDDTIPVSGSDTLFADAPGPAAYLRFPESGHADYLLAEQELMDAVVLAFLDLYLRGDGEAFAAVPELVDAHDSATLEVKPAP